MSETVHIDESVQALLRQRSFEQLVRLVWIQMALVAITAILAWLLADTRSALSALAGGLVYFIPSVLVVFNLLFKLRLGRLGTLNVFLLEAFKIALSIGLMLVVILQAGAYLVWPAFLIGLIVVLNGYLLLLFKA